MNQPANRAAAPAPVRVGQGTAVEQSRAVAEVLAAVQVAQQVPRDILAAQDAMRSSCRNMRLAERAFFAYPKGGSTITGPSVYLARELARCWGNVQYGISELLRDDDHGQSEMLAFAWDVQTNTRNSSTFINPHKREKRGVPGGEKLIELRDIYESNANNGARRVREAIFAILPPWFVEEAKELCAKTLAEGGGVPLQTRLRNSVERFGSIGVTVDQLEQRAGRPTGKWNEHDLAQLGILFKSIERGELRKDEEFPPVRVTVDEIKAAAPAVAEPTSPLSYSPQEIAEGS